MEKVYISQTIKIYPTKEQLEMFKHCLGLTRFMFNKMVDKFNELYYNLDFNNEIDRKRVDYSVFDKYHLELLKSGIFLNAPSLIQSPAKNRFKQSMIKHIYENGKLTKKSKNDINSFQVQAKDGSSIYARDDKTVQITRLGNIKLAYPLRWDCVTKEPKGRNRINRIKFVTFFKKCDNWYASFTIEISKNKLNNIPYSGKYIAFDWGCKDYITTWDGEKSIKFNLDKKILKRYNENISRKTKKLNSKLINSNNYKKAKKQLEKAYFEKTNFIKDSINNFIYRIIQDYDFIIMEDLSVKKHKYISKINSKYADNSFYKMKNSILLKSNISDKKLILVDKLFPSTQKCSNCGNVKTGKDRLKIEDRIYKCEKCNYEVDRDLNAAINLYVEGKK